MSARYPRVRIHAENGSILARDVVSVSFYMRRPHLEVASLVMHSLETFLGVTGPALGRYVDEEGNYQQLDEAGWVHIRERMKQPVTIVELFDESRSENRFGFSYRGRSAEQLDAFPNDVCAIRYYLPTEYLEEHGPARVRELALQLLGLLPICSGHAGLALNVESVVGADRIMREYATRYPGLEIAEPGDANSDMGTRVAGPSWLTFLGQPILGALGGVPGLRGRLHSPGTTVQGLEGDRVMVTLGEWPDAGDLEESRPLPAYRELARVLEPWLFRKPEGHRGFFDTEADLRRWERRFLD